MDAILELISLADSGDVKAQEKVGVAYLKGSGVEKNINKAIVYFQMCAENGSGLGNYQLGKAYENGNGVVANIDTAISYYKKSAELGYINAQNVLKRIENENITSQVTKSHENEYTPPSAPESTVPKYRESSGKMLTDTNIQLKSKSTAAVLAFLLGGLGVHNFYMGYTKKAVIQLILTLTVIGASISGLWSFVEFIMILTGNISCDASGHSLK